LFVLAGIAAPTTFAAQRMWVGFHDDPSFRWNADRDANVASSASQSNATIMRLLVQWNLAAKTRPASATDPFDPAYELDDVDEAVRTAQQNDQEVDPHDHRDAEVGERWQEPERHANAGLGLHCVRARDRVAVLRDATTGTRSSGSSRSGTNRTCSSS
jgi:hypothetical protein